MNFAKDVPDIYAENLNFMVGHLKKKTTTRYPIRIGRFDTANVIFPMSVLGL